MDIHQKRGTLHISHQNVNHLMHLKRETTNMLRPCTVHNDNPSEGLALLLESNRSL